MQCCSVNSLALPCCPSLKGAGGSGWEAGSMLLVLCTHMHVKTKEGHNQTSADILQQAARDRIDLTNASVSAVSQVQYLY